METYLSRYDSFTKKIVYSFRQGDGGIGDCIKYFMYTLYLCMKYDIQLYYLINSITLEKHLILKHPKMYIRKENMKGERPIKEHEITEKVQPGKHHIIFPQTFWKIFKDYTMLQIPVNDVFDVSDQVKVHSSRVILGNPYNALHIRLGDKFLETDAKYNPCKNDVRELDEEKLYSFLETNSEKLFLLVCDNQTYKLNLKQKYKNVVVTNCAVAHTNLQNTTEKQIVDAFVEFYLMAKSEKIFAATHSGFSIVASKFSMIPYERI